MNRLMYGGNTAVKFDASALDGLLKSRNSRFHLDLSNANLVGVMQSYQAHKRKQSPGYSNSAAVYQLKLLESSIDGGELMPIDVCDDFWIIFENFLTSEGIRPSTIEGYFNSIRAALTWGAKHNCKVSETYADFDIKGYTRTHVALTADEVSMIAHFDVASAFKRNTDEFVGRAMAMLDGDIEAEQLKRYKKAERLIKHAQKNYHTAVAAADRERDERLNREVISAYKKRKAASLYIAALQRAKDVLDVKMIEAEHVRKPLTEAEKNAMLKHRIEALANQADPMRKVKIETYERVRDQFILQCSLGQRYSDISRITPSCFSDDLNKFTIVQQKTGHRAIVDIPKFAFDKKVVRQILNRYGCYAPYPRNISNFNKKLKELVKMIGFDEIVKSENKIHGEMVVEEVPKWQIITSHTARRSFATYNFNVRGFSEISVRRATGHTDGRSFERYIIFDEE